MNESGRNSVFTGGEVAKSPSGHFVKYDVDSLQRYYHVFVPTEPVYISEKIHGANSRFCYRDGQMYCGSRGEWKKEFPTYDHIKLEDLIEKLGEERGNEIYNKIKNKPITKNMWWQIADKYPQIIDFCKNNQDCVLYGEAYGQVQNLKYGTKPGEVRFAAFDILKGFDWINANESRTILEAHNIPQVPLIDNNYMFDLEKLIALAEGQSLIPGANHIREGIVVKPVTERRHADVGRVCLKIVSSKFLEKDY